VGGELFHVMGVLAREVLRVSRRHNGAIAGEELAQAGLSSSTNQSPWQRESPRPWPAAPPKAPP